MFLCLPGLPDFAIKGNVSSKDRYYPVSVFQTDSDGWSQDCVDEDSAMKDKKMSFSGQNKGLWFSSILMSNKKKRENVPFQPHVYQNLGICQKNFGTCRYPKDTFGGGSKERTKNKMCGF